MSKKTIKYNEAISELNGILSDLESERVDVDELTIRVKRAVELIKLCREKIEETELEVRKIVKEFDKSSDKEEAAK
ncbi:MAG: exodeoxyribonuclease VII small subunit [Candidatus Omnitrophica bacterium]|jgi:exodeoxyribonuclease VII small subunit|nr:exodeoxyribonuclease VII small subunit [Candidatus Omnitrophota bacterium]